jgi:transketolase
MRNAFIEELVAHAETRPNIALVVGDLGYSVIEPFADRFPERFINAGVAEQNMMGLAAGMASEGYHVFVYSIGNFPTFRCAEQIRNDVDYHKLPVTIVAVGGGLAYGALGYSHHTVQDYALMRSLPNMLIASPGDPMEVRACMRYLIRHPQPSYLRLAKAGEPCYHQRIPEIIPGRWVVIEDSVASDSIDRVILTTGAALHIAIDWKKNFHYADRRVMTLPLWSQASKGEQINQVSAVRDLITIEDHLIDGGFGSWLLESVVSVRGLTERIRIRGLDSRICGMVGSQALLQAEGGIGSAS